MIKLRILIVLLAFWVVLLFNIERWDLLAINIPSLLYIMLGISLLPLLLLPVTSIFRFQFVAVPIAVVYLGMRYFGIFTWSSTNVPSLITELAVLFFTLWLARKVSINLESFEKVIDHIGLDGEDNRILNTSEGEQIINSELFRARRYDRSVAILFVKLPSIDHLQDIYPNTFKYQLSLEQQYYKMRIARIIESMVYSTDSLVWYGDSLIICLPETTQEQAENLAQQISDLVQSTVSLHIPLGVAVFPDDGLIYTDLIVNAENNIKNYTYIDTDFTPPNNDNDLQPEYESEQLEVKTSSLEGVLMRSAVHTTKLSSILERGRHIFRSVMHDIHLMPTNRRVLNRHDRHDNRLYYDPDYWVNRIPHQSSSARRIYDYVKRLIDLVAVLLLSPLLLFIAGIVAVAIKLEDGGTIFFAQNRTGLGGHKFQMYKFRSMVENAEKRYEELGVSINERGETVDAEGNKLTYDPRVTRVGRFIRKTSLDELPQLWNVFRGDMSLVGPRPTSFGVDKYQSFHTQRLSVKPGITGLWQIHDRGDTDFDNRLVWDIKYIDKYSLLMDINILFRTVNAVVQNKGAR